MTIRSALVCLFLGFSVSGCGSGGDGNAASGGSGGSGGGSGGSGGGSDGSGGGSGGSGGGNSGSLSATQFGEEYKFSDNEVPGWTQTPVSATDPSPYTVYDGTGGVLGGGDIYTPNGCRVSMFQDLTSPGSETCTAIAMDFVTAAKATAMFTYQQQNGYSISIPGYDASTALGLSTFLGLKVTAHFGASYFELWLSGFADATSAGAAAEQFLDLFKSKTN